MAKKSNNRSLHQSFFRKHKHTPWLLPLLIVSIGLAYFVHTSIDDRKESPTADMNQNAQSDVSSWTTYSLPTLQLQFKLPPRFASLGDLKEKVYPGFDQTTYSDSKTESILCGEFEKRTTFIPKAYAGVPSCQYGSYRAVNPIILGAATVHFSVPADSTLIYSSGFIQKNGTYLIRYQGTLTDNKASNERISSVVNPNGLAIIKIQGTNSNTPYSWPSNLVGAIVNTQNSKYPGLTILFDTKTGFTNEEVDIVLKSFTSTM